MHVHVWQVRECDYGCRCDGCERGFAEVDFGELRRSLGCKLADTPQIVQHWANVYVTQIEPGYLDLQALPVTYMQVAAIGDQVIADAQSQRHKRTQERIDKRG